jgi:general secretion pathway protein K
VVVRRVDEELRLSERLLPTEEPFADAEPSVLSRSVTALRLQYLDESGEWQDAWNGAEAGGVPRAVRVELSIRARGRTAAAGLRGADPPRQASGVMPRLRSLPRDPAQDGVALVIVLITLSLLLTIAAQFAMAMRIEGTTTLNFRGSVAANSLAEAALHRAIAEILPASVAQYPDEQGLLVFRRAVDDPARVPARDDVLLGPGRFSYRITDEESRLNLNRMSPDLLHRLLSELGVERADRDVIVDSIQDWRDANDEHHLNGAESDYYLALPTPYRAKNAEFDSVDELLQVKGVTRRLLYGTAESSGLAEYVTVFGSGAININTASPQVLRTLGFAPAEVDLLLAGRPYLDLAALSSQLRRGTQRTRSDTFRIEAHGEVNQVRRTLVVVVQRRGGPGAGAQVVPVAWRWSDGVDTR